MITYQYSDLQIINSQRNEIPALAPGTERIHFLAPLDVIVDRYGESHFCIYAQQEGTSSSWAICRFPPKIKELFSVNTFGKIVNCLIPVMISDFSGNFIGHITSFVQDGDFYSFTFKIDF